MINDFSFTHSCVHYVETKWETRDGVCLWGVFVGGFVFVFGI